MWIVQIQFLYGENVWDVNFLKPSVALYSTDPVREKQLSEILRLSFELCKAFDHWRISDFLTSPTQTRPSTLCERLAENRGAWFETN